MKTKDFVFIIFFVLFILLLYKNSNTLEGLENKEEIISMNGNDSFNDMILTQYRNYLKTTDQKINALTQQIKVFGTSENPQIKAKLDLALASLINLIKSRNKRIQLLPFHLQLDPTISDDNVKLNSYKRDLFNDTDLNKESINVLKDIVDNIENQNKDLPEIKVGNEKELNQRFSFIDNIVRKTSVIKSILNEFKDAFKINDNTIDTRPRDELDNPVTQDNMFNVSKDMGEKPPPVKYDLSFE